MMSYLQQDILKEMGLNMFDAWAGNFTEIQHTLELAPEGTGYQQKTRMAKFFNLPELMALFRMVADIKTAADLDLPVPTANRHIVKTPASDFIKQTVTELAERARKIRLGGIDPKRDNMLKIVNEGRLMALDQRLMNDVLPDDPNSKVNVCVQNVFDIWQNTADKKGTQMIFSDLATPKADGSFDVYNDIKQKLIDKGIPENEIAFIHDCKTDAQKLALFAKVSKGDVRVLLGSTGKMGTGTNCQQLLTALHNLDVPYRPADLEQREGRIIRQGNTNDEVDIYNYITEGTFDAYMYQLLETKMKFIAQIMTSQNPARVAEDVDATVISYAEMKAIASGDTRIKQKMELEMDVTRLSMVFSQYQDNKRKLQEDIAVTLPQKITTLKERIEGLKVDIAAVESTRSSEFTSMTVKGKTYTEKKEAGQALLDAMKSLNLETAGAVIGEYRGFDLSIDFVQQKYYATLKGAISHKVELGSDVYGNLTRIDNALNDIANHLSGNEKALATAENQLEVAKSQVDVPFEFAQELEDKQVELARLNKELSIDDDKSEILPEEERQNNNISTDDIAV